VAEAALGMQPGLGAGAPPPPESAPAPPPERPAPLPTPTYNAAGRAASNSSDRGFLINTSA
jgi:hypothetical protein